MPTADEQVVVDGQRALAVSEVSGDFIYDGGATDPYCIVDNNGTAQRALKVANVGEGGGGGGTVDQTYDPTSTNAQSGTAVAEAVAPALKNTATGTNALTILGTSATGTNQINIGNNTKIDWGNNSIILGTGITSNGHNEIIIGSSAKSGGGACTIIGSDLVGNSWATFTTSIGYGNDCSGGGGSARLALGAYSKAKNGNTIAIGSGHYSNPAVASAAGSIQLGSGENSTADSFQVFTFQLLDGTTGLIPAARIGTGYDATKTQVLKNVNGTLTWVDE